VRIRDADATRNALIAAARELFACDGFDRTTVRGIADRAGVNQALLFRYFGNKEGLFAEAIRDDALALLDAGPRHELLDRTIATMFDPESAHIAGPLLALLRGSSRVDVRDELTQAYIAAFADLVDLPDRADAVLRAELFLAWLLGISLMPSTLPEGHRIDAAAAQAHVLRAARALLNPT
jgi:AcrR family transcriptional regulator